MADSIDLLVRALALPVGALLAANGIDDLYMDLNFYFFRLFRDRDRRLSVYDLKSKPQQRIAIMVPAWHEAEVIEHMLRLNLESIDYAQDNYAFFVGTYINDLDTQEKVDAVAQYVRTVHKVVTPHEGPTCKADCLNWVYQGLKLEEERSGRRFDILLMHDAEDVIHPLSLRLYNYYLPEFDFVQTPVFPLHTPWNKWVAGTYIDEFCEHHLKDMLVRGRIGGLVPSAGVGSAFSRNGFEAISALHSQQAFNPESVTEDYEIGLKFRLAGMKTKFITRAIGRIVQVERGWFKKRKESIEIDEYVATREFFPDDFYASLRQRSRWVLGIAIQAWAQLGWPGDAAVKYCLYRDRKALVVAFVSPLGYVVALYCTIRLAIAWMTGLSWSFEYVFVPGSLAWFFVLVNTVLLLWRCLMKFLSVDAIFGPFQATLALPRFALGSLIAMLATLRAMQQWVVHLWTGTPIRWAKTTHVFPNMQALREYRRQLGDLLLDREGITAADLSQALALHKATGIQLGEVCSQAGLVKTGVLVGALSDHLALEVIHVDPFRVPIDLLRKLRESDAERLGVLPVEARQDGAIVFAISLLPTREHYEYLEALFGRIAFSFCWALPLSYARERAYRRLSVVSPSRPRPFGEDLVHAGLLSSQALDQALRSRTDPGEPLGELVTRLGLVSADAVATLLHRRLRHPSCRVRPEQANLAAIQRMGYGICCLYGLVPIAGKLVGGPLVLAGPHPLHAEVVSQCELLLGSPVTMALAPTVDTRLCLALASLQIWPKGIEMGAGGLDGAELAAIGARDDLRHLNLTLLEASRRQSLSPVTFLERQGSISEVDAALLRAQALGLPLIGADEYALCPPSSAWLSPEWEEFGVSLVESSEAGLIVAAPRPRPFLARRLAALFPDIPISWRVSLPSSQSSTAPRPSIPSDSP